MLVYDFGLTIGLFIIYYRELDLYSYNIIEFLPKERNELGASI